MSKRGRGLWIIGQNWTRGGRGSKIPEILRTSYVHGPLAKFKYGTHDRVRVSFGWSTRHRNSRIIAMNKGGMEGTERQGGWRSPHTLSHIQGGLRERFVDLSLI